ncbi:Nif11-like leader peptide family natural product precursor [Xanthobacteraceae bacterium A53D]
MSISEIERFSADLKSNDALRAEAEAYGAQTSTLAQEVTAFASAKGYAFTADELAALTAMAQSRPIPEDQLESVSGGTEQDNEAAKYYFAGEMMLAIFSMFMRNPDAKA